MQNSIYIRDRISDVYALIACLILQLVLSLIFQQFVDIEIVSLLFVFVSLLTCIICILNGEKQIAFIVITGFVIRILFMIFDNYSLALSNFNGDSLGYYSTAELLAQDSNISYVYGGLYSKLLGVVLKCAGTSRCVAESFNIVIGIAFILTVYACSTQLEFLYTTKRITVLIATFFPYAIYNSVVTYREGIIMFLCLLSFYYLIRWIKSGGILWAVLSLAVSSAACAFHAGVVALPIGFSVIFAFYDVNKERMTFRKNSFFMLLMILSFAGVIVVRYPDIFLGKLLSGFEDSGNIITHFNYSYGGSRYLAWINANSLFQVVLFSPLKAFYFAFSPLPLNWRGISDILAFLVDSFFYIFFFCYFIKNRKFLRDYEFFRIIFLVIVATFFIFGIGTWTAGTAMRHRCKVIGLIILLFGKLIDDKEKSALDHF